MISVPTDGAEQRLAALSTWDNEGGAGARTATADLIRDEAPCEAPRPGDAELVHLRVRMIAVESLMITLLAEASDRQIESVRDMARFISPRPGSTRHALTIKVASHIIDLVERAGRGRTLAP